MTADARISHGLRRASLAHDSLNCVTMILHWLPLPLQRIAIIADVTDDPAVGPPYFETESPPGIRGQDDPPVTCELREQGRPSGTIPQGACNLAPLIKQPSQPTPGRGYLATLGEMRLPEIAGCDHGISGAACVPGIIVRR